MSESQPVSVAALHEVYEQRHSAPAQKSAAWLTQRDGVLTASDFAAVDGSNPYSNARAVMRRKLKLGAAFHGNYATRHGERYEDEALDAFEAATGLRVAREWPLVFYTDVHGSNVGFPLTCLAGSPDGVVFDADGAGNGLLIEVKCPLRREIEPGVCPPQYLAQVNGLCAILGLRRWAMVQYKPADHISEPQLDIAYGDFDPAYWSRSLLLFADFLSAMHTVRAYQRRYSERERYWAVVYCQRRWRGDATRDAAASAAARNMLWARLVRCAAERHYATVQRAPRAPAANTVAAMIAAARSEPCCIEF